MNMREELRTQADDVDRDIRRFVDALNAGYASYPGFSAMPLPERRAAAEKIREPWRAGGPVMARSLDLTIDGVRARMHVPKAGAFLPAMLYIHGGGWTMFSIDTHDRLMREYAARAGIVVVGLDYSLSPEAKFPRALDEIVAAVRWLREHGREHGILADRIALGGDSAGGNLSVAAALKLRDLGEALPSALLLNYGAFGTVKGTAYDRYGGPDYMLTITEMDQFWLNYTRDPTDLDNPLVTPLNADLHGLPPSFLAIAECDILADGNHVMARKLVGAGVQVEKHAYSGATHSFLEAVSIAPLADHALDDAANWLRTTLGRD
jgi:acetyl esterase